MGKTFRCTSKIVCGGAEVESYGDVCEQCLREAEKRTKAERGTQAKPQTKAKRGATPEQLEQARAAKKAKAAKKKVSKAFTCVSKIACEGVEVQNYGDACQACLDEAEQRIKSKRGPYEQAVKKAQVTREANTANRAKDAQEEK